MNTALMKFGVGAPVRRKEDNAFVTGKGCFTDDISRPRQLHGYVVRSPLASARFKIVSTGDAKAAPGVQLILTGEDVKHLGALKTPVMQPEPGGDARPTRDIPILCTGQVRYVGDAIAFVVAETAAQAQDAADLIEIDYDPLDAATGTKNALEDGVPLVWPELGSNLAFTRAMGDKSRTEAVFAEAAAVSRIEFINNRLVCNFMEPRAALAEWVTEENRFVLTTGTQGVHSVQRILCQGVFGIDHDQLRVVTPDVGGGFGTKSFVYREYALVMESAKRTGRPVKWTSSRTEHFLTDAHGRDNFVVAEMAMDKDSRFKALRIHVTANMGAYLSQFGPMIPGLGAIMATGVYDIDTLDLAISGIYTNTCPVDAYRGAGRPEAALLIERLVDVCARDTGLSPVEIRRRNFIKPADFPYKTQGGRLYDVGEFEGHLVTALDRARWQDFEKRLEKSRKSGKIRGIGLATYVEACAFAGSEPAHAILKKDGNVEVLIGTQSNGQGHATAYAQFVAEKLNLDIDHIAVLQGDTDRLAKGGGTGGSRSIPLGGVSAARAGEDLAVKIRKIAADELEAAPDDIELGNGEAMIVGTDRSISFAAIAAAAKDPDDLKGFGEYVQKEATYPNGTHVCEVEIDPQTGVTEITRYTIVDDFGAIVNPLLLEGQVHGGAVQGIGQALMEDTVFSEDGQLLSASFMDYAMPRADNMPTFSFETRNVPSTTNALGIKGAGEAGAIGATPAAINAVTDALFRAYEIRHIEMPATPLRIWEAINQARTGA